MQGLETKVGEIETKVDAGFLEVNKKLDKVQGWGERHIRDHFEDPRYMSFDVWLSHNKWKIFVLLVLIGAVMGGAVAAGSEGVQAVLKAVAK